MERIRRDTLARTRVFVKIFLNDKFVQKTAVMPLKNDFSVYWGEIFNVYMIYWPESIKLQVCEIIEPSGGGFKLSPKEHVISEIIIPIPDTEISNVNLGLENYEFASKNDYYMRTKENKIESMTQAGVLRAAAYWGTDDDGKILAPPKYGIDSEHISKAIKNFDAIAALGVSRMQDVRELAKWVVQSNLDPNDPHNADLINLIRVCIGFF